jgi:hypothetical protein
MRRPLAVILAIFILSGAAALIDEIVAPGTNVKADERGWDPPWLTDSALRRR